MNVILVLIYSCVDINECDLGIDNCTENEECKNRVGSFECHCKIGYERNETHCTSKRAMINLNGELLCQQLLLVVE